MTHNRKWDGAKQQGVDQEEYRPGKHLLLGESHSKSAVALLEADPNLANALREKLSNATLHFATGKYKDDMSADPAQAYRGLAREMYHSIRKDEDGSLVNYGHLFTNFACVVGNTGYCGSIPCFRFKVQFVQAGEPFWLCLFFTPTAEEDGIMHDEDAAITTASLGYTSVARDTRAGLGAQGAAVDRIPTGIPGVTVTGTSPLRPSPSQKSLMTSVRAVPPSNGYAQPAPTGSPAVATRGRALSPSASQSTIGARQAQQRALSPPPSRVIQPVLPQGGVPRMGGGYSGASGAAVGPTAQRIRSYTSHSPPPAMPPVGPRTVGPGVGAAGQPRVVRLSSSAASLSMPTYQGVR